MSIIEMIDAREVLDSRGNPTVQVDVLLESGAYGRFTVPSGASTGSYEALELRDGDKSRYNGKGVLKAVNNIKTIISPDLIGEDVLDQLYIDNRMLEIDGTENKSKLGANAILGVSVACARAASEYLTIPLYRYIGGTNAKILPVPMINILNGGKHADSGLDIQEFLIMPIKGENYSDIVRMGSEVFYALKGILKQKGYSTSYGDEGGFAPKLKTNGEAFELILEAIDKTDYKIDKDIVLGFDAAANEFYKDGTYRLKEFPKPVNSDKVIELYEKWVKDYHILSIEDGLFEDDWAGWKHLNEKLGMKIQLVGDDLFVTNINRLKRGISENSANSILIKLNQIGSLTETLDTIRYAQNNGWTCVVSHRSGETSDTTIADLAVAMNTGFIKTGSVQRQERTDKYNRLMEIEDEMFGESIFPGIGAFTSIEKTE
ncbi:phosphopyruvate hydratase [candidate division WOR-3 bacterium]|nr:phosphopyruvate hydratase [candidate division WOR-3 bacterium]